jgi:hypothetical protein
VVDDDGELGSAPAGGAASPDDSAANVVDAVKRTNAVRRAAKVWAERAVVFIEEVRR